MCFALVGQSQCCAHTHAFELCMHCGLLLLVHVLWLWVWNRIFFLLIVELSDNSKLDRHIGFDNKSMIRFKCALARIYGAINGIIQLV